MSLIGCAAGKAWAFARTVFARGSACILTAAMLMTASHLAVAQQRVQIAKPQAGGQLNDKDLAPLVNADEEFPQFIAQAQELINAGAYDRAIQILQAIVQRPGGGYVRATSRPASSGEQRFLGMGIRANEVLGSMPPEGIRLYRGLYDGQAQGLFEKALQDGQISLLHQVAYQYMHTKYGAMAMEELGSAYFDRGRFTQAAYFWEQAMRLNRTAPLIARAAVAWRLDGRNVRADELADELREKFPDAADELAGRRQNLVEFVSQMSKAVPTSRPVESSIDWPGLGGVGDGLGVMPECGVAMAARWSTLEPAAETGITLIAESGVDAFRQNGTWAVPKLRHGQVVVERFQGGGSPVRAQLSPAVHPIVQNGLVIYRTDDEVVACDLLTGEEIWQSHNLPLDKSSSLSPTLSSRRGFSSSPYPVTSGTTGDSGRYMLTAGDGLVFVRHSFGSKLTREYLANRGISTPANYTPDSTSSLAAIDARTGLLRWNIGGGKGDCDIVKAGRFVSPATCQGGRVYIIVLYVEQFHMLCLDARSGGTLWTAPLCHPPSAPTNYYYDDSVMDLMTERCSPPAVADGRVFALTNTGVVVAMEAQTGQPLWAYQYADVSNPAMYRGGVTANWPVNPIIVSRDRVFCMPADGNVLLSLSAADGGSAWSKRTSAAATNRREQNDLSVLGDGKLLLSGPGLILLSMDDGSEVARFDEAQGVVGRPAVTRTRVLASGDGELCELRIDASGKFHLTKIGLTESRGLLGNLVSAGDTLLAANSAGVCAYFGIEAAWTRLGERMRDAPPDERMNILFRRARLAFSDNRTQQGLADMLACRELAGQLNDVGMSEQARSWIYRTYVALGGAASDPAERLAMFQKAISEAGSTQELAHMQLRLAKHYRDVGQYAQVVVVAQELGEKFADERLVDVALNESAGAVQRFEQSRQSFPASELAQRLVRETIELHGREVYADFDARAKEAFDKARTSSDPDELRAVFSRWPNSEVAADAMFAAAEACVRKAKTVKEADELSAQAKSYLASLAEMPDAQQRLQAGAVLATLYARGGKTVSTTQWCDKVRASKGFDPALPVKFDDIRGTLGEVLKKAESRGSYSPASVSSPSASLAELGEQLDEAFTLSCPRAEQGRTPPVILVRDADWQAVRINGKLLALYDDRFVLVDPAASGPDAAIVWSAVAPIRFAELPPYYVGPGSQFSCAISADGKVLAVASLQEVRGYELATGKACWRAKTADLGVGQCRYIVGSEGMLIFCGAAGDMKCLDAGTGRPRQWIASVEGSPWGPPIVKNGMVLAGCYRQGGATTSCFDLSSGKLLASWSATSRPVQVLTNARGLLIVLNAGLLSVHELQAGSDGRKRISSALWEKRLPGGVESAVLGVSDDVMAVAPNRDDGTVQLYSLPGGPEPIAELATGDVGAARAIPVDATFVGGELYVVCSSMYTGYRKMASYGSWSASRGYSLQKFDLSQGRRVWQRNIVSDSQSYYPVLPLTLCRKQVIVTLMSTNPAFPGGVYVVDAASGRDARESFDWSVRSAAGQGGLTMEQVAQMMMKFGPAAVVDGRLLMEATDGLKVYASSQAGSSKASGAVEGGAP